MSIFNSGEGNIAQAEALVDQAEAEWQLPDTAGDGGEAAGPLEVTKATPSGMQDTNHTSHSHAITGDH